MDLNIFWLDFDWFSLDLSWCYDVLLTILDLSHLLGDFTDDLQDRTQLHQFNFKYNIYLNEEFKPVVSISLL